MAWFDSLASGQTWATLWHGRTLCPCGAIRWADAPCPVCRDTPYSAEPQVLRIDGHEYRVPVALMGAEARYEDWQYLEMIQREWQRPPGQPMSMAHKAPSAHAAILLVFWSYFETRIDRLLTDAMAPLDGGIRTDLLRRYASIGVRLDKLYRILFGVTYLEDVTALGHGPVAALLDAVHQRRNQFAHGEPGAIDDAVVRCLVEGLADEHEAWIAAYNHRAAPAKRRVASTSQSSGSP